MRSSNLGGQSQVPNIQDGWTTILIQIVDFRSLNGKSIRSLNDKSIGSQSNTA
jgi:hypothetical protein